MLGKLLKYDLKWILKVIVIFYALALIFSIIGRALLSVQNSLLFDILGQISTGIATGMLVSSLINCLMRSWARFVRNVYKDEAYLTHTLPVSKKTIYLSKVLATLICFFITMIVILVCLAICYYTPERFDALKTSLQTGSELYNISVTEIILIPSLVLFFELVFVVMAGYAGIILGHKFSEKRNLRSIMIGLAFFLLKQFLTLGVIYLAGIFSPEIMNVINTVDAIKAQPVRSILLISMALYVLYILAYYFISSKQFEKGVNVD